MGRQRANVRPVLWRRKSRASFYYWYEVRAPKIGLTHIGDFGEEARAARGLQGCLHIAFRDEAHAQRA